MMIQQKYDIYGENYDVTFPPTTGTNTNLNN